MVDYQTADRGGKLVMRRFVLFTVLALSLVAAPQAMAATASFTLNVDFCTNPCLGGVPAANNGGTVTLTDIAGGVDVLVTLASGLAFHDQGLTSFAFNSTITLAATDITVLTATGAPWTVEIPAVNSDGAGKFGYGISCTAAAGACAGAPTSLHFTILHTGLTIANLETLAGPSGSTKVDFAANVSASGGACTGVIGGGNGS